MFVKNNNKTVINFKYKVGGLVKNSNIPVGATIEFPMVTSINEVVFSPIEQMQRQVDAKFGRTHTYGTEYRMVLSGATL